jgi:hypothetical protein
MRIEFVSATILDQRRNLAALLAHELKLANLATCEKKLPLFSND